MESVVKCAVHLQSSLRQLRLINSLLFIIIIIIIVIIIINIIINIITIIIIISTGPIVNRYVISICNVCVGTDF